MALTPRRHRVGGTSADVTQSMGDNNAALFEPAETLWTWDSKTGGSRVVDLALDPLGASPVTEVTSDASGQVPEFYTPAGAAELYISSAAGANPELNPRVLLSANDLSLDINLLDEAIENIEVSAGVQSLNGATGVIAGFGPANLSPVGATAAGLAVVAGIVGVLVLQEGAGYPPVPTGANFAIFVGAADPGAAADTLPSIWLQPESTS